MRKYLFPILLLTFFWSFIAMRGDGEVNETMVVSAAVDDGRIEGGPALAAMNHGLSSFGGLAKDSMNIIAILLVSIVLALRRRVLRRGS